MKCNNNTVLGQNIVMMLIEAEFFPLKLAERQCRKSTDKTISAVDLSRDRRCITRDSNRQAGGSLPRVCTLPGVCTSDAWMGSTRTQATAAGRAGMMHYCSMPVAAGSSNSHQDLQRSSPAPAQEGCESGDRPGLVQGQPQKEAGGGGGR